MQTIPIFLLTAPAPRSFPTSKQNCQSTAAFLRKFYGQQMVSREETISEADAPLERKSRGPVCAGLCCTPNPNAGPGLWWVPPNIWWKKESPGSDSCPSSHWRCSLARMMSRLSGPVFPSLRNVGRTHSDASEAV